MAAPQQLKLRNELRLLYIYDVFHITVTLSTAYSHLSLGDNGCNEDGQRSCSAVAAQVLVSHQYGVGASNAVNSNCCDG